MSEKNAEKSVVVSKADYIRNWLKNNKDFSPKWMARLFEDLQSKGFKIAKHDSIYVYSIKSKLEKMAGKSSRFLKSKKTLKTKSIQSSGRSLDKNSLDKNDFYRIADLAWHLKSIIAEKSCNVHDIQEAIRFLEYLEVKSA